MPFAKKQGHDTALARLQKGTDVVSFTRAGLPELRALFMDALKKSTTVLKGNQDYYTAFTIAPTWVKTALKRKTIVFGTPKTDLPAAAKKKVIKKTVKKTAKKVAKKSSASKKKAVVSPEVVQGDNSFVGEV